MKTVHLGIKSHLCGICGAAYSQSSSLKEHIMVRHEGLTPKQRKRRKHLQDLIEIDSDSLVDKTKEESTKADKNINK